MLLLIAAVAGCGGDGGTGAPFTAAGGPGSDPNPTDAEFARTIVENGTKTAALVELARERGVRKELRKLARATAERQATENPRLARAASSLSRRGVRPAGSNPVPPGVDARRLRDAVSFDHEFMVQMIRVHEHAVAAAEVEQDRGGDPNLKRLAGEVLDWRTRDLEQLRRWLSTWYGESDVPEEGPPDPSGPGGMDEPEV